MRLLISITLALSVLTACDGAQVNGDEEQKTRRQLYNGSGSNQGSGNGSTNSGLQGGSESDSGVGQEAGSEGSDEHGSSGENLPGASMPISIGGAALTCSIKTADKELLCLAVESGKPKDSAPEKAFIQRAGESTWIPTTVEREDVGVFVVQIPPKVRSSFTVAIRFANKKVLVGTGPNHADFADAVLDGSFETFLVPRDKGHLYVLPSTDWVWKRTHNATSLCSEDYPEAIAELIGSDTSGAAASGSQWAELDSVCPTDLFNSTFSKVGGNIDLFQNLTLKKGNLYMIRFVVMRATMDASLQKLRVNFQGEKLLEAETTAMKWTTYTYYRRATGNAAEIRFSEIGLGNNFGTRIDDVRVIDLGTALMPPL